MTDHPVTPPSQLLQLWFEQHDVYNKGIIELLIEAARYGADQELEACCMWASHCGDKACAGELRAARRPKPPSLKDRALQAWAAVEAGTDDQLAMAVIRRALEELPE
jgi:hypothetical protein